MRVRINLLDALRGPGLVLRLIPQKIAGLDGVNCRRYCAICASALGDSADHRIHGIRQTRRFPRHLDQL